MRAARHGEICLFMSPSADDYTGTTGVDRPRLTADDNNSMEYTGTAQRRTVTAVYATLQQAAIDIHTIEFRRYMCHPRGSALEFGSI